MIEQLNQQKALLFIAGNEESWDLLPRDVPPRLRLREPLKVGNLDAVETGILLGAYTKELSTHFSDDSVTTIQELSGGNAREIIRIAYHAYEKSGGKLDQIDSGLLVESAAESGSIEDRNKLALTTTDAVLGKLGTVLKDHVISDDLSIDRLLEIDGQARIAVTTIKATDKLAEIDSARRIASILEYLRQTWTDVPLIVVTVGYSSSEIKNVLQTSSIVLRFDEGTFLSQLQSQVTTLRGQQRSASVTPDSGPAVLQLLTSIASRLDKLEIERVDSVKKTAANFAEDINERSAPERKERDLRTRWDLLDELDELREATRWSSFKNQSELVKSILVANEAHLKIKQLDYMGGLFLDLVAEAEKLEYRRRTVSSPDDEMVEEFLRESRLEVIGEMRRILRGPSFRDKWLESPWRYSLIASLVVSIIWLLIYLAYPNNVLNKPYLSGYPDYAEKLQTYWWFWPLIIERYLPVLLFSTAILTLATFIFRFFHRSHWTRMLTRSRRLAARK
jgi:hypothetical protein